MACRPSASRSTEPGRHPGPRGDARSSSTINGSRDRGAGVLDSGLHVGRLAWNRLVWNRLRCSKDPDSGRRRSRPNDSSAVVTTDMPDLRIVSEELWQGARARQERLSHREDPASATPGTAAPGVYWSKQRPKHLSSGLLRCGGGFSKISAAHFGCSTARDKGPAACANLLTARQDRLESTVVDGLRERLMDPVLFEAFAAEFTAEWNKLQASLSGRLTVRKAELARIKGQLERLVDALVNGTPASTVRDRRLGLEDRRIALEAEWESAVALPLGCIPTWPSSTGRRSRPSRRR